MNVKKVLKSILTLGRPDKKQIIAEYMAEQRMTPIHKTQPQDIFIAAYPKSGNTWMQNLISGIIYGVDTAILPDKLTQKLIPNVHKTDYYKRFLDFACFKTHEFPKPHYKKVVYLVRDGRDAMVSYYHMNKAIDPNTSFERMIKNGEGMVSKWHEHIKRWEENPYGAEMIQIRYEHLHSQPMKEMRKFCNFAGIERSDEVLQRSIEGNQLVKMKKKEKQFGWDNDGWDKSKDFIRRGKVGSFKDEMDPKLLKMFEQEAKEQLVQMGYELTTQ